MTAIIQAQAGGGEGQGVVGAVRHPGAAAGQEQQQVVSSSSRALLQLELLLGSARNSASGLALLLLLLLTALPDPLPSNKKGNRHKVSMICACGGTGSMQGSIDMRREPAG